jgi:hypothetical protein
LEISHAPRPCRLSSKEIVLDGFLRNHRPAGRRERDVSPIMKSFVPEELALFAGEQNGALYADGFFYFSLDEYRQFPAFWGLDPEQCLVFMKTAFGALLIFHDNKYRIINPVLNSIDSVGDSTELKFVLDIILCDRDILESNFCIDVYEKTYGRLGAPTSQEIYAFVPALGLGGPRSDENVEKRNMFSEMAILSTI